MRDASGQVDAVRAQQGLPVALPEAHGSLNLELLGPGGQTP
ncbi:hypothetical protein [Deinococcus sp.]|nr:hypothetical protein [Deinococcus sp.]